MAWLYRCDWLYVHDMQRAGAQQMGFIGTNYEAKRQFSGHLGWEQAFLSRETCSAGR